MGFDFYVETYLNAHGLGGETARVLLKREGKHDSFYDSDSEGACERQRRLWSSQKVLLSDGVWRISCPDKRDG